MSKWLVLLVSALLLLLTAGVVSATHNTYGYLGSGYGGYGYGAYGYNSGYRDYGYDCGSGYGGYGYYGYRSTCRTDTFRDTTENRHTTLSTSRDRYTTESVKTITTSYTDIRRETRTPTFPQFSSFNPYRTFYPSRTVIGNVDGFPSSYWRFKEPFDPNNPRYRDTRYTYYYEPRYDSNLGYYNWRW